VFKIW